MHIAINPGLLSSERTEKARQGEEPKTRARGKLDLYSFFLTDTCGVLALNENAEAGR